MHLRVAAVGAKRDVLRSAQNDPSFFESETLQRSHLTSERSKETSCAVSDRAQPIVPYASFVAVLIHTMTCTAGSATRTVWSNELSYLEFSHSRFTRDTIKNALLTNTVAAGFTCVYLLY